MLIIHAGNAWKATWPKLAAITILVGAWQLVVWTGWRSEARLPPPLTVMRELRTELSTADLYRAMAITGARAAGGYSLAVLLGTLVGLVIAVYAHLRAAVGSLITGLQTIPSIAWFPLALLLFNRGEAAILVVVVLGAAPVVANGLISGIDHVPPIYLRAGRILGARGISLYRGVVLPASLPSMLSGMKQGWAFAWRSLLAGELIVGVGGLQSLGVRLQGASRSQDAPMLLSLLVIILVIGILVDSLFSLAEGRVRRLHGLVESPGRY
ncbi:MAG: ABC transporter permease [Candidatus Dormibacteria bacterium]